ncbi:hypothetical protein T01_9960 [Trichinella spiralis]|uniref:Uncharacterized protein n=1 Tax=Trichinella spiralis TaxID=6334 RepID=A0A0V1B0N8_TRISP|nr:hypothetical protein T01_9960 [Trichinella spiralis]
MPNYGSCNACKPCQVVISFENVQDYKVIFTHTNAKSIFSIINAAHIPHAILTSCKDLFTDMIKQRSEEQLRIHKRKFYASLPYLDFTLESQKRISCLQWRIGEDGFSTLPFIPIGLIRVNSTIYVAPPELAYNPNVNRRERAAMPWPHTRTIEETMKPTTVDKFPSTDYGKIYGRFLLTISLLSMWLNFTLSHPRDSHYQPPSCAGIIDKLKILFTFCYEKQTSATRYKYCLSSCLHQLREIFRQHWIRYYDVEKRSIIFHQYMLMREQMVSNEKHSEIANHHIN